MIGHMIGALARLTRLPVSTIRFYERKGLLNTPERTEAGYRVYPQSSVDRLQFIRHAQASGFTLHQIHRLLRLESEPNGRSADVRREAEASIEEIRAKITALEGMESSLKWLLSCCRGDQMVSECPIIIELHSNNGGKDGTEKS